MFQQLLTPEVVEALITLGATLFLFLVSRLTHFLNARVKSEYLRSLTERVEGATRKAVLTTEQELGSRLREMAADGKLVDQEKSELRSFALRQAKLNLGSAGLKELRALTDDVDRYLGGHLEAAVFSMPRTVVFGEALQTSSKPPTATEHSK